MTDAHNHLQQLPDPDAALIDCRTSGVTQILTNGTRPEDWPQVAALAHQSQAHHPASPRTHVLPSFGLHPWHVPERTPDWLDQLRAYLHEFPTAAIGECGLDRWKKPFDLPDQIDCLRAQIELAIELRRPLTIHCLQAWGPLLDLLQSFSTLPSFLLHAYSGSAEMIGPFAELGAYFSFNGYFLHERKVAAREAFRQVPPERLLIETDAPAMLPPPEYLSHPLPQDQNHPANLPLFIAPLCQLLGLSEGELCSLLERNFETFFAERPL